MRFTKQIAALAASLALLSSAVGQDAPEYDPSPFLSSMVSLRAAAVTCDVFVANSPAARTSPVLTFFEELKQPLPDLADRETQSSLNRFVGSQAASLCRDKLNAAFNAYDAQAGLYLNNKPEEWPDPPEISRAPWCGSEYCLEF